MSFTNLIENTVLDSLLGDSATLLPNPVYIGLSTTTINDDGSGITEPTGGSYAKVSKANSNVNFPGASAGVKKNATPIEFPTATGDWGTITDWFISDSGGTTIYVYGKLDDGAGTPQPRTVLNGDEFKILANQLRIELD